MTWAATVLFAAVSVAFPKDGARLPTLTRCYMIGATDAPTTNLVVQGRHVEVASSGAWVTMLDLAYGTNRVDVAGRAHTLYVSFPKAQTNTTASVYQKLPYAGDVAQPAPTNKAPDGIRIVLDPGHGGADNGALSPHGIEEKDANLRMAKAVRRVLEARGYHVVMTRETDVAVPLYDRPKIAHADKADAFVSIHHNAPPYDKDPRTLRYHAVYAWNDLGERLAKAINRRMGEALDDSLRNNGVVKAQYAVTRNPEIPSCLIEVDFITTPEGELDSWNPSRRAKVADAIAAGIVDWCGSRQEMKP